MAENSWFDPVSVPLGFSDADSTYRSGKIAKSIATMPTTWRQPVSANQRPNGAAARLAGDVGVRTARIGARPGTVDDGSLLGSGPCAARLIQFSSSRALVCRKAITEMIATTMKIRIENAIARP